MSSVSLWSPYIWKFEYEFDYDLMYSVLKKTSSHWSVDNESSIIETGDAYSTARVGVYDFDHQPHRMKELQSFNSWLEPIINQIWVESNFFQMNSEVSKSWFNVHKKTGQTLEHVHNKTDLVVSAYVRCEEGSGNIEFRDPLEYHKINSPWHESQLWKELPVKTNDVLVFPGWLNHRTQPNTTDTQRIVMTYNINGNPTIL